ncbi:CoA transferase, partial [Roseibium sp.]
MLPLTGLRVVDFTHVLAGPACAYYLGLMGAEDIKVES